MQFETPLTPATQVDALVDGLSSSSESIKDLQYDRFWVNCRLSFFIIPGHQRSSVGDENSQGMPLWDKQMSWKPVMTIEEVPPKVGSGSRKRFLECLAATTVLQA